MNFRTREWEEAPSSAREPRLDEFSQWKKARRTRSTQPWQHSAIRRVQATKKRIRVLASQPRNNLLACDTCHLEEIDGSMAKRLSFWSQYLSSFLISKARSLFTRSDRMFLIKERTKHISVHTMTKKPDVVHFIYETHRNIRFTSIQPAQIRKESIVRPEYRRRPQKRLYTVRPCLYLKPIISEAFFHFPATVKHIVRNYLTIKLD